MSKSRRAYFRRTRKTRMRELSHSKQGWAGLGFALAAALLFVIAAVLSYRRLGESLFSGGSIALFALILAAGGLAFGILGCLEENVRPIPPRAAVAVGAGMTVLLLVLYILGL